LTGPGERPVAGAVLSSTAPLLAAAKPLDVGGLMATEGEAPDAMPASTAAGPAALAPQAAAPPAPAPLPTPLPTSLPTPVVVLSVPPPPVASSVLGAAARGAAAADDAPRLPVEPMALAIARHAVAGGQRFEIRLDPAELGRIDVRLELADDGTVKTRMIVEKAETLDLLQRDQRVLEKALAQTGFRSAEGGVEFSLRGEGGQSGSRPQDDRPRRPAPAQPAADSEPDIAPVAAARSMQGSARGLDLKV
jgi:flagellar hook-length control protein FliK